MEIVVIILVALLAAVGFIGFEFYLSNVALSDAPPIPARARNYRCAPSNQSAIDPVLHKKMEQVFCQQYIKRKDAVQAYMAAFPCSEETAKEQAPQLLQEPRIQQEINRQKAAYISANIITHHLRVALADTTDMDNPGKRRESMRFLRKHFRLEE